MEHLYTTEASTDYEFIDSGEGEKLERYGKVIIRRPDPQVLWEKTLSPAEWSQVSAHFERSGTRAKWKINTQLPEPWTVTLENISFVLELSPFKHVGLFPEQSVHWKWLSEKIKKEVAQGRKISVLNLFAYTGGATLACAKAGAEVCHIDASKHVVDWASKNRDASGLEKAPIRFIVDDVRKFVEREIKRGSTYDIILLDPPVYGRGVKNEIWKIEEDLAPLLSRVQKLLSKDPLAVILNGYASGYSHVTYAQMLLDAMNKNSGSVSSGELELKQSKGDRFLSCGIFARWEK